MPTPSQQHLIDKYVAKYDLKMHLNADLLRCLRVYQFEACKTFIAAGTEQTHLYFLVNGKAQVGYDLVTGKRSIIMVITPFAVIGDMEFFKDEKLHMNVTTTEPSVVLGIRKTDALHYGYDDPRFLRFIIQYMSHKLQVSGFYQLSYDLPLLNRVAAYLLNQPVTNNMIHIESKAIVADLLGSTVRHLNRTIQKLEEEYIIRWDRQHVFIQDRDKLQSYGEL